jgi:hypothetical protein
MPRASRALGSVIATPDRPPTPGPSNSASSRALLVNRGGPWVPSFRGTTSGAKEPRRRISSRRSLVRYPGGASASFIRSSYGPRTRSVDSRGSKAFRNKGQCVGALANIIYCLAGWSLTEATPVLANNFPALATLGAHPVAASARLVVSEGRRQ